MPRESVKNKDRDQESLRDKIVRDLGITEMSDDDHKKTNKGKMT